MISHVCIKYETDLNQILHVLLDRKPVRALASYGAVEECWPQPTPPALPSLDQEDDREINKLKHKHLLLEIMCGFIRRVWSAIVAPNHIGQDTFMYEPLNSK